MSLVRLTIRVEEIATVACDFDFIEIYRAETQWGSYSKITTDSTRLELCAEQEFYEYDDKNGSEYYWYKWKYTNSDGTESDFSQPAQAYTPNATYCGLEDVKRELRSRRQNSQVRFSDQYKNLRHADDTPGDIYLSEVSISPEYSGLERFKITFTSSTDFKVEVYEESYSEPRFIGTGSKAADFTANDGSIYINSGSWTGTAAADSVIEFEADSHMSTYDAIRFIHDSEIFVDMLIEENLRFTTEARKDLRFERDDVPKTVKVATAKFAAFFIYSSIYNEQAIPVNPASINDITLGAIRDDISSWPRQAMRLIQGFIKKYTENFDIESGNPVAASPRWISMEGLFDAKGVAYVGEGIKVPELDRFFAEADMSYAGLLDYDILGVSNGYFYEGDGQTYSE